MYSPRYARAFGRAVRVCRKERFLPVEAFRLGLFDPDADAGEPARYVSRKRLTKIQKALNPESWAPLARDKGIFYRYCMAVGVPIPRLYAIFFPGAGGWSCDGASLAGREDWQSFLSGHVPPEFVVKPARGAWGRGVNVFGRNGREFTDAFGVSYTAESLYEALRSAAADDGIVLQERLRNHPELIRLSGTEFLQTVRVITLLDGDGCRILHAHFKPIVGPHVVDTFLDGMTGPVQAAVELESGLLKAANQITGTGRGIRAIPVHPETGVAFEGFALPLWQQTRALVEATAVKFWPLRTIGWDVALTPNGPRIVEGNVWWDPPNQHDCMGRLVEALSAAAGGDMGAGR